MRSTPGLGVSGISASRMDSLLFSTDAMKEEAVQFGNSATLGETDDKTDAMVGDGSDGDSVRMWKRAGA